jgi:hypothetical protein
VSLVPGGSPIALRAFDRIFLPWMHRRLRIRIAGLPGRLPPGRPVVLVANHTSWWDGFLLREVHRLLRPRAPLHTVMLASELRRRRILRALGGVGIEPGDAGTLLTALRTLRERVDRSPETVVIFFPQGRIWPTHRRPLGFQRGVELFVRRLAPATVLPVAIHLEPLHRVAPTAFVLAGASIGAGVDGEAVERAEGQRRTGPAVPGDPSAALGMTRGVRGTTRSATTTTGAADAYPTAELLEERVSTLLDSIHDLLARRGEGAEEEWPGPFQQLEGTR